MTEIKSDQVLDCKGLSCPMPMLKIKKAFKDLKSGQILEVWGTDPGTKNEISEWCKKEGHELLAIVEEAGYTKYFIKKK